MFVRSIRHNNKKTKAMKTLKISDLTLSDNFTFRKQSYNVIALVNNSDSGILKEVWAFRVDGKGNEFGKIAILKPNKRISSVQKKISTTKKQQHEKAKKQTCNSR